MPRTRVLIADDHSLVRQGASQLVASQADMEVVGEVDCGRDVVQRARELRPDVVVLDISMPDLNGLDLIVVLRRASPATRIVVLSFHQEPMMVRRALSSGAKGYVAKSAPAGELIEAIRAAALGYVYLSSHIDRASLDSMDETTDGSVQSRSYDQLTEREQQVFRLVVQGKTSHQIGDLLCISSRTVEKHRAALMQKLGVKDAVGLIRCAVKLGVVLADD